MIKGPRLGFALVGCGRIALKHASLLASEIEQGRLVAVCDLKRDRAVLLGERFNVPFYTDMLEMAQQQSGIDVFVVLTESGNHARDVIALSGYGKDIVVEKPMALTLDDADDMIRSCDAAGVKLFVVKQNRFNLPVQKLREAFIAGRFGKIVMGTTRVRWCRRQDYYDQDAWRGTWALDGGVFSNQASHHIDLLEWFLGIPETVYATSRTALVDTEVEDTGVAVIRFVGGAIGVVEATTATRPSDLEGSLSLLGENGTAEIGGFAVNEMKVWNFDHTVSGDADVLRDYKEQPQSVYGFGHKAYLNHVCSAVLDGHPLLIDGLEGRKSLELISAIYESIASRQEVVLRFRQQKSLLGKR